MSDTDDSRTIQSIQSSLPSTPSTIRKKRTVNVGTRSNQSHTVFFFRVDENNPDIAYCKMCEQIKQKAYPYSRKGGNTSNMIGHLREKHGIIKENYTEYLDKNKEPKKDQVDNPQAQCPPVTPQRQEFLERKLIQFIIQFVLPLYILKNQSFHEFVSACEPGFKIPCEKTAKGLIHDAYNHSKNELSSLLLNSVTAIHLTTDLWTAKSQHGYLGVTATWLSSDFKFREVLLSCNHLAYPHTGEVISEELFQIIHKWRLENTVFTIATDNGANMVKAIRLLRDNYFDNIKHQPCAAHTLQLSVQEGLKQCKAIHRRVKNLQNFFRLPKQAQRLREAQHEINQNEDQESDENPLDVLTDVKTRWNSTYLAWQRVLQLHNAIRFVSTSLLAKTDRNLKKEGEKLEKLCLSVAEKEFLHNMTKLLKPIETVTRHLCGAEYPTLNLVYPYMEVLKKSFAPKDNDTIETYINLIYGEENNENDNDYDDYEVDNDIPSAGTRQHWQYAHRQFRQKMKNTHVQRQERRRPNKNKTQSDSTELEELNPNNVEYLQPVSTDGLLQRVQAAIYLSMGELWAAPTDIALVATFLDPRFKHFNWTTQEKRNEAHSLTRDLYEDLKRKLRIPDDVEEITNTRNYYEEEEEGIFSELESASIQANFEDDELANYMVSETIGLQNNPMNWWLNNKSRFPILAQLARKYLSVPSTSVPSERLFSDAGNHISAKRTRLAPDLVDKFLFLKRNSSHFDIFPPQENEL